MAIQALEGRSLDRLTLSLEAKIQKADEGGNSTLTDV